jgi:hypothetical protein
VNRPRDVARVLTVIGRDVPRETVARLLDVPVRLVDHVAKALSGHAKVSPSVSRGRAEGRVIMWEGRCG